MRSRDFRSSRINRDHREASFARAMIAQAERRRRDGEMFGKSPLETVYETIAKIPDDCHEQEARNTVIMMKAGQIEVCPDCLGSGEIVRQVADDRESEAICLECNGRGWVQ